MYFSEYCYQNGMLTKKVNITRMGTFQLEYPAGTLFCISTRFAFALLQVSMNLAVNYSLPYCTVGSKN